MVFKSQEDQEFFTRYEDNHKPSRALMERKKRCWLRIMNLLVNDF